MSLGAEIVMAVVGLWATSLRPLTMRFAAEMVEVLGRAIYRICRGNPSYSPSSYLPYSTSFLY
ncbi:unnamed protein product [Coffea canephora]|uniref:Uncharacterized protein n=1 Tax=Coffea canephora TaxID=49390 RepID=A0A068UBM3_COFCA|nr:unnamed protein product [Coffea canephora]